MIKEVKETSNVDEVNKLLKEGWTILNTFLNNKPIYIMAFHEKKTTPEVPVQEQPKGLIWKDLESHTWNDLQNYSVGIPDNFLRIILNNAVRNNGLNLISEQLGISIQEVKKLRQGGSANINTDKLFKFIYEYIANPKIMIKD